MYISYRIKPQFKATPRRAGTRNGQATPAASAPREARSFEHAIAAVADDHRVHELLMQVVDVFDHAVGHVPADSDIGEGEPAPSSGRASVRRITYAAE
jgi:hypothetical protein